jgi:hypothetical protein
MKATLRALGVLLAIAAAAAAWVWYYAPQHLPAEWRQANPHSSDYAPVVYRWKDAQGVVQLTDRPPSDRPYEAVRIDPNRNIVPSLSPATED